jgi:hypothetical protein
MEDEYSRYSPSITAIRNEIFTSADEAVSLIKERRKDRSLIDRVIKSLKEEVPSHFQKSEPIFYLSRYIATPNFEFLRAKDIAANYKLDLVVGEDLKSTFVGSNELKRKLGKLTVVTGKNSNGHETFENFTIVDFSQVQGKNICDNQTLQGLSLCEFHHQLLKHFDDSSTKYVDESAWVDANYREDILLQYEQMLTLLCVHGIMLESYPPEEHDFLENVVYPAFQSVIKKTNCKPLIVEHISDEEEYEKDWNAYPTECYEFISNHKMI